MKKLIAVLVAVFSINATAFVGTGNDQIDAAREYLRDVAGGANINNVLVNYWLGAISGISAVYGQTYYAYSVCYPEGSNSTQLAEIAARWLVDRPEERAEALEFLVWKSHGSAFGWQDDENCWMNTEE